MPRSAPGVSASATRRRRAASAAALGLLAVAPARAETLLDAVASAYQTNPTLRAQRAELRAVDEGYVQARAGYGPTVSVTLGGTYQAARLDQPSVFGGTTGTSAFATTGNGDLSISQSLFNGGRTASAVSAASADVLAAREALRQTEAEVLQAAISAYLDVRRDAKIVALARGEVDILAGRLDELRARGALGALSVTDVSQGEARWLEARTRLVQAQARLEVSRAAYLAAVGHLPGELAPEPALPPLPGSIDAAFAAAEAGNPQLLNAVHTEEGSRARIAAARAEEHASLSLRLDVGASPLAPYDRRDYDRNATAAVVLTQPIFTSGLLASRVREALDRNDRDRERVEAARRAALQAVSQAWGQISATQGALEIEGREIDALQAAATGERVESRAGLRTVIDLLNAEQELLSARIGIAGDEHDAYLGHAALLQAMGRLEIGALAPDAVPYDACADLLRNRRKFAAPWEGLAAGVDRLGVRGLPSSNGLMRPASASAPSAAAAASPSPAAAEGGR